MNAAEILRDAAELVERPGAWTQGELARDRRGLIVHPLSDKATCFCAIGAMRHVSRAEAYREPAEYVDARAALIREVRGDATTGRTTMIFPGDWNDAPGRTAAEVAEAMRRAAATLDAGGGA